MKKDYDPLTYKHPRSMEEAFGTRDRVHEDKPFFTIGMVAVIMVATWLVICVAVPLIIIGVKP